MVACTPEFACQLRVESCLVWSCRMVKFREQLLTKISDLGIPERRIPSPTSRSLPYILWRECESLPQYIMALNEPSTVDMAIASLLQRVFHSVDNVFWLGLPSTYHDHRSALVIMLWDGHAAGSLPSPIAGIWIPLFNAMTGVLGMADIFRV